ncbi:NADH-quinone oxidoreductase subunit C [Parachlamydia sp. AcF125]|uniref:NADH-quinone oxidoreductase subunit C n=1 Tax=Parachlamydia sp. AcF125 TaxID=2795736 RepID=UPI001BCA1E64|nr:NADH-quinone oxidoreductase subunit C [Parachlamydia sp. AcF125]MBS4167695.1 NADH-quinone oxidoreductase chain 5 [Parachlamydia sp. AcF125]
MKSVEVAQNLKSHYPEAVLGQKQFLGETTIEVKKEALIAVLGLLKRDFEVLMDLTAVDYVNPSSYTKVVYWLHNPKNMERIRIVVFVGREESLPSVTGLWEGASWYERELFDLFGVHFEGHPDLKRILMPDDWKGHPLRRDYPLTEQPVQFKHGVEPKIPSQIISHDKNKQKS